MTSTSMTSSYLHNRTYLGNTTLSSPPSMRQDLCDLPRKWIHTTSFICLLIFIPITVIGNLFVVAVISSSKSLKKQTAFMFLASLAIADTLVGLVSMPFNARMQWKRGFLCLGPGLCWVYTLNEIFLSVTSVIHLFIIGIDRYISLKYVYQYNTVVTRRRVFAAIFSIWGFSAFVALISIFKWKDVSKIAIVTKPSYVCKLDNTSFFTAVYISCFLVPLIIMIYTYHFVYRTASRHINEISKIEVAVPGTEGKKWRDKKRKKRQNRMLKSIVIVFIVYCICWYPTIIYILSIFHAKNFWEKYTRQTWWQVMHFMLINFLPALNSTTNPFIYVLCNKQFRKVSRQLYYKITNQEHRSMQYITTFYTDTRCDVGCNEDAVMSPSIRTPVKLRKFVMKNKAGVDDGENSVMI